MVVLVFFAAAVEVFVDAAAVDESGVDGVLGVVLGLEGDVEALFEVGLDEVGPSGEGNLLGVWGVGLSHGALRELAILVELVNPAEGAVKKSHNLNCSTIAGSS